LKIITIKMPKFYPSLTPDLTAWLTSQPVFFTATAPTHGKHINLSPKGHPSATFRVLSPTTAAYLDATGSGAETIAHIYENGRVTIMFTSFATSPRILRLFCRARVVEVGAAGFGEALAWFGGGGGGGGSSEGKGASAGVLDGSRAVVVLQILKVQTSCGYGVPVLVTGGEDGGGGGAGLEDRETLGRWAEKKVGDGEMVEYRAEWNSASLDGLPGLRAARRAKGEKALWVGNAKAWVRRVGQEWDGLIVGAVVGLGAGLLIPRIVLYGFGKGRA
jgi:hypothetical protein